MRYVRFGLILAAFMALPATAGAVVMKAHHGHRYGVALRPGLKSNNGHHTGGHSGGSTSGVLQYFGGPVLQSETPYIIYWAPKTDSIPTSSTDLLDQYLTDVANASATGSRTNVYSVLTQYGASKSDPINYSQTFSNAQVITDTTAYPTTNTGCSTTASMPTCVSDASIQTEIGNVIKDNNIPVSAPGSGNTEEFFVVTPEDVNVCMTANQCSSNYFCAYHSYFVHKNENVLYASVPFSVFADFSDGCQADGIPGYQTPSGTYAGNQGYQIGDNLSHEFSEMITDPLLNAWFSKNGLEVGDLCEAYGTKANVHQGVSPFAYAPYLTDTSGGYWDQLINGDQYYNQTEYSNSAGKCMTGTSAL